MDYFPALQLNDKEHIESLESKYINSEEVAGEKGLPVRFEKSTPGIIGFDIT